MLFPWFQYYKDNYLCNVVILNWSKRMKLNNVLGCALLEEKCGNALMPTEKKIIKCCRSSTKQNPSLT